MQYQLTYAGVPFFPDMAHAVRMTPEPFYPQYGREVTAPRKHQVEADLVDELDRVIPFKYLNDFRMAGPYPGRNLGAIAYTDSIGPMPDPSVRLGDWYYPTMATRWSVFRYLATSSAYKAMLAATGGTSRATFVMKAAPDGPTNPSGDGSGFTLTSSMYMLPGRPLAEHGGQYDGLYLVTLVDERWYWQGTPALLNVDHTTTWGLLVSYLAVVLGVTISPGTIDAAYGQPEPDSQLWCNFENAAVLLDAVAANIGKVVVRALDGTYALMSPAESRAAVLLNRGNAATVIREAGGDIFASGSYLKAGDLTRARNAVAPAEYQMTFPCYVQGDDPVPHYLNSRYAPQRPGCWYEESYGRVYSVTVPIASGGSLVSGMTGTGQVTTHTTAKALYASEASGLPTNNSGLVALALRAAQDYYGQQVAAALDEVYPGTLAWSPEGIHDVVWTYSARSKGARTRVLRAEWNQFVREYQHAAPALSGQTVTPRGVGGPSVAQTWRGSESSGSVVGMLGATFASGDMTMQLVSGGSFPTTRRWRGWVDGEAVYMEGTGGTSGVAVVYRGIDGTVQGEHASGSVVVQSLPNTVYGANLVTVGDGLAMEPGLWQSGGIQEVKLRATGTITLSSGSVVSGTIASGAVTSGTIASGTVAWWMFASGAQPWVYQSGNRGYLITNGIEICGWQAWCCQNVTLTTGSNNDLALASGTYSGATVYDIDIASGVGNSTITGVANTVSGIPQLIVLRSVASGIITISDRNNGSASGNQIIVPPQFSGVGINLAKQDAIGLWWDRCTERTWVTLFTTVQKSGAAGSATFTLANNQVGLDDTYSISGVATTAYMTVSGLNLTLPGSGLFRLEAEVVANMTVDIANIVLFQTRLYDDALGVAISGTTRLACRGSRSGGVYGGTAPISINYAVTSGVRIFVQAGLVYTAPPAYAAVISDLSNGGVSYLSYFSLGN